MTPKTPEGGVLYIVDTCGIQKGLEIILIMIII